MDKITKKDRINHIQTYNEKYYNKGFNTRTIHYGQPPDPFYGSVNTPIHMTSTFAQTDAADPIYLFDYGRVGNPTREALESVIASLEGGKYGLTAGSGLGCTMIITHTLKSGDHILCVDDIYGGTGRYFRKIAAPVYGMESDYVDMTDLDLVKSSIKENTKMIWLETPTNPLLKCFDIQAISEICKEHDILFVVDNTFMTCYNQKPLELGADIVVNSVTKYLGGHSDVVMGSLVTNDKELYERLHFNAYSISSATSPMDCYFVLRSIKTLSVRMEKINSNALTIAEYLQKSDKVGEVYYPMLPTHKYYETHKKQATGGAGVISFVIKDGDAESSRKFLKSLKIFIFTESLGGVESLAECPALMTHVSVPKEHREKIGIVDGLVRIAVGMEDAEDLIADIDGALAAL